MSEDPADRVLRRPLGEMSAADLVGALAGAVAAEDYDHAVLVAVEVGRRIERGEIADAARP